MVRQTTGPCTDQRQKIGTEPCKVLHSMFKVGCTTILNAPPMCTNVHQCAPTVGIINSHDDRVHSNLGQMPRSNLLRMIPKKRMSIESFWVLNCKLLRLLLKSCGAAIPYQLCSSTLTIGRLRYNKPQPSVTPAIPAANPAQRFTQPGPMNVSRGTKSRLGNLTTFHPPEFKFLIKNSSGFFSTHQTYEAHII